jgi:LPXTG-motif cell wall-anchored protein
LTTRRPLTITAVAAGLGTAAALALGPMASAATTQAGQHDVQKAAAQSSSNGSGSNEQLADTGVDTTPYALGGAGFLVAGVGMIFVSRRFAG